MDDLPFYRQEKQFERLGVELGRGSMSSWAMKVAEQCGSLMDLHKAGSADVAIGYIQMLYAIDKEARALELGPEELCRVRQQKAKPILDEFKAWLTKQRHKLFPTHHNCNKVMLQHRP